MSQSNPAIITLQIGQCGVGIGAKFWEMLANEHNIEVDGMFTGGNDMFIQRADVYYRQANSGKFVPRAILTDLESSVLEALQTGHLSELFRPTNFVMGNTSSANVYAKGYYTDGAEMCEPLMECLRKETEECDLIQGIQFMHSLGGGTGSGLASLLMMKIREEYPDKMMASFTVYPSPKVSDIVVEPYNSVLSIHQMLDHTDETFILDNEALYEICIRNLKIQKPGYSDLNHIIGYVESGITTSLRFPGQLNADLRKLATNLVPFPRLHFFLSGFAPICSIGTKKYRSLTVTELTNDVFDSNNIMAACNPKRGKYLTAAAIFRGHVSTKHIDECISDKQTKSSSNFSEWIPNNIKTAICDIPPPGLKLAATFVANSTAMQDVMKRIDEQYEAMYKRSAFLHWYLGEGMERDEFQDAQSNLKDLISEYQQYEDATADPELLKHYRDELNRLRSEYSR